MKSESTNPTATPHLSVASPFSAQSALVEAGDSRSPGTDPIEEIAENLLRELGEDPKREGLLRTPHRVAKAMRTLTSGYGAKLEEVLNGAVFDAEGYREMVLVRDVEFYSLCEHHLLPFFGRVSVAYLPGEKIIGLSKIPRLVDVFARRFQLQERMTAQIAETLRDVLQPRGVAVAATGFHLCMAMRGVAKQGSVTTTTAFLGAFRSDHRRRDEFLRLMEPGGETAWTRRSSF
jgi:GTP cyclohydrolase I